MKLWADVYSAAGVKLGDGPVTSLLSASVTRALDGAGTVAVTAPLSDERARSLLTNEARIRVYVEEDGDQRELGRGIVRKLRLSASAGDVRLTADGPDLLDELKRVNTLLAREYVAQTVPAVVASLVALASGWSATSDAVAALYSSRFDGASVLKALQTLAAQQGLHLRLGTTAQTLEVGAFGSDSGLTLVNPTMAPAALDDNDDVALIDTLSVSQDSEAVANWLLPLGAGEGAAALTLARSTRTSPYTIQTTTGPDGQTLYFLSDAASIAVYGTIQKVGSFKNIAPISNSDPDQIAAANALYDAAAAWLARYSVRQDSYGVTLKKARQTLRPGQTLRLVYRGIVERDGEPFAYLDVDEDLWILKVTEGVSASGGLTTALEVSTVDRYATDAASVVIGALDAIELRNVYVQPYPSRGSWTYREDIDATHPVIVPVKITDATLDVTRALLTLTTRPLRTTATGAASGGGSAPTSASGGSHRHRIASSNGGSITTGGFFRGFNFARNDAGSGTPNVLYFGLDAGSIDDDIYTYDAAGTHTHTVTIPSHTHAITYGIADDTVHPQTVSVLIDGIDRTVALGGPWAPTNTPVTVELDITTYLRNAAGGLRQEHTVEVRCASGQGAILASVELFDVVQAIRV